MNFDKKIKIGNKKIFNGRCFIVAEISANHAGKINILKKLILKLKKIGVDAVKIQAYEADTITFNSNKKDFRIKSNNSWAKYKNLYELYKEAQTPFKWYDEIFKFAKKNRILTFASVFDASSLNLLESLGCPAYKIASNEITDLPLISKVAETGKPIIISNGLSTFKDLNLAIQTVKKTKNKKLVVLKCTSTYPNKLKDVNLKTMIDINRKFGCLSGFSDHTTGFSTSLHAASIGAVMLEKHVMLKKTKSVDSFFSLDVNEFSKMINQIRENEISSGKIEYDIVNDAKKNLNGRRSLYVVKNIKKGEKITTENVKSIRPTYGLHPKYLSKFLNKKSIRNASAGSRVKWNLIKKELKKI